jgi:prophage antirepressor-like protein
MNQLEKVQSNLFGDVECDFFTNEKGDIIMTAEQIGSALDYADGKKAILNLYARNPKRFEKFSTTLEMRALDGKLRETRIFNEQGIYALIFLSNKPKAIDFQEWVYERISDIRKNNFSMITSDQSQPELLTKVRQLENRLESFVTLNSYEARSLQKTIARRVYEIVDDPTAVPRSFAEIHREIRDRFGVPSYRDVQRLEYSNAINYVRNWIPRKVSA